MGNIQKITQRVAIISLTLSYLLLPFSCKSPKVMTKEEWENGSFVEESYFTESEVDNIVEQILNAEHKNKPYQAPADKVWQLKHTDIDIALDFTNKTVLGKATIQLHPYFYPQKKLILDAKGMDIFSVSLANQNGQNGGPKPDELKWSYTDSLHLIIEFPYTINTGELVSVSVAYQSNPERKLNNSQNLLHTAVSDDKGVYFINADDKNPLYPKQVWTQGEPESNSRWFPTLDNPNQKHTKKIIITYPAEMISVSNGYLVESKRLADNLKQDIWEMREPHAVYLSMFAVGSWTSVPDTLMLRDPQGKPLKQIPLRFLVESNYQNHARDIFGNTAEMIQFFSDFTGVPFPWNKYDQIVCREFVSGAMENTTAVVHNERLQDPNYSMEDYISHELFHHWFGDYATCESWSHLSMNESFACYSEYLWREHKYGKINAEEWLFDNTTFPYLNEDGEVTDELETSPLINPHFKHPNDQFDDIRYNKGAQILHELRQFIGDEAFKKSINTYLTQFAFDNGNAQDWKRCIERVTGRNMDHFFNSWYFQGGEFANIYEINRDSNLQNATIKFNTKIAENAKAANFAKSYGRTKFQQVYIHALGKNNQTWDTSVLIYPYTKELPVLMPFLDSICLVRYTNPQNYLYSYNTSDEFGIIDAAKKSNYVLHQDVIPYMEKIEWIRQFERRKSTDSTVVNAELINWWVKNTLLAHRIDTALKNQKPLLTKVCYDQLLEYLNDFLGEYPAFANKSNPTRTHLSQLYNAFNNSINTSNEVDKIVYWLNFQHYLSGRIPSLSENKVDQSRAVHLLVHSNNANALEAAVMHVYFEKGDIVKIVNDIFDAPENCHPVKVKFACKLFEPFIQENQQIEILKQLAQWAWYPDQLNYFLDAVFTGEERETTQLLDVWVQAIQNQQIAINISQHHFADEWNVLKLQLDRSEGLNKQEQFRYSVLQSLYSINLK